MGRFEKGARGRRFPRPPMALLNLARFEALADYRPGTGGGQRLGLQMVGVATQPIKGMPRLIRALPSLMLT